MIRFLLVFFLSSSLFARDENVRYLKGSIAEFKGMTDFILLAEEIKKKYPKGKFSYQVLPFERSLRMVQYQKADFHYPILEPTLIVENTPYDFSETKIGEVIFALYVHKNNKTINLNNLNDFNIETDSSHVNFFNFNVKPSTCPSCSLEKVAAGRIDGFLYSAIVAENIIKGMKISNLESIEYQRYDMKFALKKGTRNGEIDQRLGKVLQQSHESGRYGEIFKEILVFNKNWKATRRKGPRK